MAVVFGNCYNIEMKFLFTVFVAVTLCGGFVAGAATTNSAKPNIIVILVDDMG